jgi:hypothetical protein
MFHFMEQMVKDGINTYHWALLSEYISRLSTMIVRLETVDFISKDDLHRIF